MTVLHLVPTGGSSMRRALASVATAALARRDGLAYAEIDGADVGRIVRALAFDGVAARPSPAHLAAPPGLIPAIGRDLAPLPPASAPLDVVRLQRIPLGQAAREILRRRALGILGPHSDARARCRVLLRGGCVMLRWRREAWIARGSLRSPEVRRSLRPIVFDRAALERVDLPGRTASTDDELARWLFA